MQTGRAQGQVIEGLATFAAVGVAGSKAWSKGGGRAVIPVEEVRAEGLRAEVPAMPPPGTAMTNTQVREWYLEQEQRIPRLNEEWSRRGADLEIRARLSFMIRYQARMTARA